MDHISLLGWVFYNCTTFFACQLAKLMLTYFFSKQVLNSYSKFVVIPRKLMIGKRLSQCMHPALPSGVHLKALETYNLIFERIGKKHLSQDLFIYSVGLFPLMSHSAMSVKPLLMKLYEEHFLPLGVALVPSLPGLLLGLLPGIEEGSDYTERYGLGYQ